MNLHNKIMNLRAQGNGHDYLCGHRDARHAAAELAAEADGLAGELLAALEAVVVAMDSTRGLCVNDPEIIAARAAIAKAKGEAQ